MTFFGLRDNDSFFRLDPAATSALNVNRNYFGLGNNGLAEFNGSGFRALVWDAEEMKWVVQSPNPLASVFDTFDFLPSRADYNGDGKKDLLVLSPIPGGGLQLVEFDRDNTGVFTVDIGTVESVSLASNEFLRAMAPCGNRKFFAKGVTSGSLAGIFKIQVRLENGVEGDAPGDLGMVQFSSIEDMCVYLSANGDGRVLVVSYDDSTTDYTVRVFDCLTGVEIPDPLVITNDPDFVKCKDDGSVIVAYATVTAGSIPGTQVFHPTESGGTISWEFTFAQTSNAAGFVEPLGEANAQIEGENREVTFWNNGASKVEMTTVQDACVFGALNPEICEIDGSPGRVVGEQVAILDTDGDGDNDVVTIERFLGLLHYWTWGAPGKLQEQARSTPAGFDLTSYTRMDRVDKARQVTGRGPTSGLAFSAPDLEPVIFEFESGTGNPTIVPNGQLFNGSVPTGEMRTGDFNGDGYDDLYQLNPSGSVISVRLALGGGGWLSAPIAISASQVNLGQVYAADVNGDGLDDLVSQSSDTTTRVFIAARNGDSVQFTEVAGPAPLGEGWGNDYFDGVFAADPKGIGKPLVFKWTATFGLISSVHGMETFALPLPPDTDLDGIPDATDPAPAVANPQSDYLDFVLGYPPGTGPGTGPGSLPAGVVAHDPQNGTVTITFEVGPDPIWYLLFPQVSFENMATGLVPGNEGSSTRLETWKPASDFSHARVSHSDNDVIIHEGNQAFTSGFGRLAVPNPAAQ